MRDYNLAEISVNYIKNFLGLKYKWGGDDPIDGLDCSGAVNEMLKCAGKIREKEDYTADQLRWKYPEADKPEIGVLVFFGKAKATHVGICITDTLMIEAGGGNSSTEDEADAIRQNAYMKIRPILRRHDVLSFNDPFLIEV